TVGVLRPARSVSVAGSGYPSFASGAAVPVPATTPLPASTTTSIAGSHASAGAALPSTAHGRANVRRRAYRVEAFDQRSARWHGIPISPQGSAVVATIAHPDAYVGPGGTLVVRVVATSSHLTVQGAPTVSTHPEGTGG
ncbi:MAG: hypothetical protein ACRDYD_13045, partial [Acidimicrobiales bacterium]